MTKLTHLQARLPHELLLLVLCRVRMPQMRQEPRPELVGRFFRQVSPPPPLLAFTVGSIG